MPEWEEHSDIDGRLQYIRVHDYSVLVWFQLLFSSCPVGAMQYALSMVIGLFLVLYSALQEASSSLLL